MALFRKRPVTIEAVEVAGVIRYYKCGMEKQLPQWVQDAYVQSRIIPTEDGGMSVVTMEGTMSAPGEAWLIKGVRGELYFCNDGIFKETYEPVE
jgi:hypothetical protein